MMKVVFVVATLLAAAAAAAVPGMGASGIRGAVKPTEKMAALLGLNSRAPANDDAGSTVCPSPPPISPLPEDLPAATKQALDDLNTAIQSMFEEAGATGGAATIVYDQTQLRTFTYGTTRQNGGGTPVTGDTVFRLGSNTKVFTAAMLYLLRDAGKVALDEQISSVYPSYQPQPFPGMSPNELGLTRGGALVRSVDVVSASQATRRVWARPC